MFLPQIYNTLDILDKFFFFTKVRSNVLLTSCTFSSILQMKHSNHKQVLLKRVGLATSGKYRCEVTTRNTKRPGFDSQYDDGSLTVLGKIRFKVFS